MSVFAIVHGPENLGRFCRDFARLAVARAADRGPEPLLGIVIERGDRRPGPSLEDLLLPQGLGAQGGLVVESCFELSGVWSVVRVPDGTTREQVLSALGRVPEGELRARRARFVPVFETELPESRRIEEWRELVVCQPRLVVCPVVTPTATAPGRPFEPAIRLEG